MKFKLDRIVKLNFEIVGSSNQKLFDKCDEYDTAVFIETEI